METNTRLPEKQIMLDKMYGGWFGKNIGGTLGGPLEGRMELMDVRFYTQTFDGPMENDDLDLQLVFLHALEQYGARLTSRELAQEWLSHVFFPYDEYGHAVTNLRRGLVTPLSGSYNNFFTDCMGSPIRSEIWAMAAAGNPELAAYYALQDATVDHAGGEGVWGEIFFASLEALAFVESDVSALIEAALSYIPSESVTAQAVRRLCEDHRRGIGWREARQDLLERFAKPNFTYAPLNIAFTILGLLYGHGFGDSICIAASCGYDTDCTAATLGAILGILGGISAIPEEWIEPIGHGIRVSPPVNGFDAPATIEELTERTYRAFELVGAEYRAIADPSVFRADGAENSYLLPAGSFAGADLKVTLAYSDGHPAIGRNAGKEMEVTVENRLTVPYEGTLRLEVPAGFTVSAPSSLSLSLSLSPGQRAVYTFRVRSGGEPAFRYDLRLQVERKSCGMLWSRTPLDFVLVPAYEWEVSRNGGAAVRIDCPTARIDFERAFPDAAPGEYHARTVLAVPSPCRADLIAAAESAVRLEIDGQTLFDSGEATPFIPAYHRSAWEKRGVAALSAGAHPLEITVRKEGQGPLPELVFLPVQPGGEGWYGCYMEFLTICE